MNNQQKIEICARVAYEASRSCGLAVDGHDFTRPWDLAGEWLKRRWLDTAADVLSGKSPEQQHQAMVEEMTKDGWKYGPFVDAEKKESPHVMTYTDLPAERRLKDQLYASVARAAGEVLGLPITPAPFTLTIYAAGQNSEEVLTALHRDLEKLLKR